MPKKTPKLKLTEIETKLAERAVLLLQQAGMAYQNAQREHDAELSELAGPGYTLVRKEDGVYREKVETKD